jgi:hypothetical protein
MSKGSTRRNLLPSLLRPCSLTSPQRLEHGEAQVQCPVLAEHVAEVRPAQRDARVQVVVERPQVRVRERGAHDEVSEAVAYERERGEAVPPRGGQEALEQLGNLLRQPGAHALDAVGHVPLGRFGGRGRRADKGYRLQG